MLYAYVLPYEYHVVSLFFTEVAHHAHGGYDFLGGPLVLWLVRNTFYFRNYDAFRSRFGVGSWDLR